MAPSGSHFKLVGARGALRCSCVRSARLGLRRHSRPPRRSSAGCSCTWPGFLVRSLLGFLLASWPGPIQPLPPLLSPAPPPHERVPHVPRPARPTRPPPAPRAASPRPIAALQAVGTYACCRPAAGQDAAVTPFPRQLMHARTRASCVCAQRMCVCVCVHVCARSEHVERTCRWGVWGGRRCRRAAEPRRVP